MFPDDVETITMTRKDYDRHIENLIYENIELKQRIDQAIEYIEDRFEIDEQTGGYHLTHTFDSSNLLELYDILKGSDSNERIKSN